MTDFRQTVFSGEVYALAERLGVDLRLDPFPCHGYANGCDCFRCTRRAESYRQARAAGLAPAEASRIALLDAAALLDVPKIGRAA